MQIKNLILDFFLIPPPRIPTVFDIPALSEANHHMGAIAVYEEDERLVVVDGQQRLTTLNLILAASKMVAFQRGHEQLIK